MREGETVNSCIDPTSVGQIKPLQPEVSRPGVEGDSVNIFPLPRWGKKERKKFAPANAISLLKLLDLPSLLSLLRPVNNKV